MHLIMYTSEYQGTLREMPEDLNNILTCARTRNPENGITGILFYDQGKFIQIIEGEKQNLHDLIERLKTDPRHTNLEILIDSPIAQRELTDWNMEAFDISSHIGKDWGLLTEFRDAYVASFKVSANQLVSWIRHFIHDHDKVKRICVEPS